MSQPFRDCVPHDPVAFAAAADEANERMGAQLAALRAVLLHPPAGSSDAEVLAAARLVIRDYGRLP